MNFKFISHAPSGQRPRVGRTDDRDLLSILSSKHDSCSNGRTIRESPSVDFSEAPCSPKSSTGSALSLDSASPTRQSSHDEHYSTADSLSPRLVPDGRSSSKVSTTWKKILHDYFKSDDESDILSSDDEFWLSRSKRLTDREPPSGKTRPPRQSASGRPSPPRCKSSRLDPSSPVDSDSNSKHQPVASHPGSSSSVPPVEPILVESLCSPAKLSPQAAPCVDMVPSANSQLIPAHPDAAIQESAAPDQLPSSATPCNFLLLDSEFPPLKSSTHAISPGTAQCLDIVPSATSQLGRSSLHATTQESGVPDQRPSGALPGNFLQPDSEFPPLKASTYEKATLSHSSPRLVCSFSGACQPLNDESVLTPATIMREKKLMSKLLAESHEKSLRQSLPMFRIFSPALTPHTISICPSDQRRVSELPELIDSICNDGIPLPSGKTNLEGGPYLAVAFDMICSNSHAPGPENRTAVLQLASRSRTLIIQISHISSWRLDGLLPSCLIELLANPQIVKVGVGIRNDGLKLLRDHKLGPKPYLNSFLELSRLVRSLGDIKCSTGFTPIISLQQLVADHLKVYLPKFDTWNSDWTQQLSSDQVQHAASNTIATIRVAKKLFDSVEEAKRSRPKLSILDFIESLEPDVDRARPSRSPAVPLPKKLWIAKPTTTRGQANRENPRPDLVDRVKSFDGVKPRTQVPKSGRPTKNYQNLGELIRFKDGRKERSLRYTALKGRVSPHVQQAWELWYHKGLSVNGCAKAMKVHSVKFGVLIGKMLVHLKLNDMTLDDYYHQKVKTVRIKHNPCAKGPDQDPATDGQDNLGRDDLEEAEEEKQNSSEEKDQDDPAQGEQCQIFPQGEEACEDSTLAEEAEETTVQSKAHSNEGVVETKEVNPEEASIEGVDGLSADRKLSITQQVMMMKEDNQHTDPPHADSPTKPKVNHFDWWEDVEQMVYDVPIVFPVSVIPSHQSDKLGEPGRSVNEEKRELESMNFPSPLDERADGHLIKLTPQLGHPDQKDQKGSGVSDHQSQGLEKKPKVEVVSKELQTIKEAPAYGLRVRGKEPGSKKPAVTDSSRQMTTSGMLATDKEEDNPELYRVSDDSGENEPGSRVEETHQLRGDPCRSEPASLEADGHEDDTTPQEETKCLQKKTRNFKFDVNDHHLRSPQEISELNRLKSSLLQELIWGLNVDRNLQLGLSDFGL